KNNPADPVWRIGDTYNLSIGQGMIQVTPLQMATVATIIARDGVKPDIHLIKTLLFEDGSEIKTKPDSDKKIDIPSEAYFVVKEGMRQAAEFGTASALSGLGVEVAGKTGTAELGAEKKKVNSWFIGFLPYKNPKIAMVIVLEAGSSQNLVGAPYAARELVSWIVYNRKELINNPQF
ncbi:MAG: penicillin-binding transpeptidase domain-containing protein, partial [Patescibacteria group bacterium]